jgi:hypothetical protein
VKRLALFLLLLSPSAFAAGGEVTVLRGSAAPLQPWYEPPSPPPSTPQPAPVVVYQPMVYPQYFYSGLPAVGPVRQHRVHDGWPLFRR